MAKKSEPKAKEREEDSAEPESESESPEGEQSPRKKKRWSGKKLVLFFILPALLLVGGAGGAFVMGLIDLGAADPAAADGAEVAEGAEGAEETHEEASGPEPVFFDLPIMLVNLNSADMKAHFLKINVSLEVASRDDVPRLEAVLPRIVDNFQLYLRELRVEDLRGSEGMYRLREELLRRVNAAVHPTHVTGVLFREMLVQ